MSTTTFMSADRISSAAGGQPPGNDPRPRPSPGRRSRTPRPPGRSEVPNAARRSRAPRRAARPVAERRVDAEALAPVAVALLDSALDVAAVVAHCSQPRRKRCGSRRTVIVHSPSVTQVHRALADDAEVLDPRRGVRRRGRRVVRVDQDGRHARADGLPHRSHGVRQARPRAGGALSGRGLRGGVRAPRDRPLRSNHAGRPRADLDRPQLRPLCGPWARCSARCRPPA